jgi:transcriptional regulator with XRE-family HTH domain
MDQFMSGNRSNSEEKRNTDRDPETGRRLNVARNLKGFTLKDIANHFNIDQGTILVWQRKGIPQKRLKPIASFFGVDEWVFTNRKVTENDFNEIVLNPSKQPEFIKKYLKPQEYEPELIFQFDSKSVKPNEAHRYVSDGFSLSGKNILIRCKLWGALGVSKSNLYLTKHGGSSLHYSTVENPLGNSVPVIEMVSDGNTLPVDISETEVFLNEIFEGEYRVGIESSLSFDISVFKFEEYPKVIMNRKKIRNKCQGLEEGMTFFISLLSPENWPSENWPSKKLSLYLQQQMYSVNE